MGKVHLQTHRHFDYYHLKYFLLFLIVLFFPANSAIASAQKTVVDQLGRTVTIPDDPKRIVSLAPSITEIIFALHQEHRLKGATIFSDYPEAAKTYPRVGTYIRPDLERIVALKPDLCIATRDGNPIALVKRLEALHVPVYAVDPRNLVTVMQALESIGQILNASGKAEMVVNDMKHRIRHVEQIVSATKGRPRVFLQIGISPIVSVGTDTFIHELIVKAGGTNIAAGSVPYPRFTREQVLQRQPEVMIITSMARSAVFQKIKLEWESWKDLPAARNGRIHMVDSNIFDRPTPRLVDALEVLARRIHPELFKP